MDHISTHPQIHQQQPIDHPLVQGTHKPCQNLNKVHFSRYT